MSVGGRLFLGGLEFGGLLPYSAQLSVSWFVEIDRQFNAAHSSPKRAYLLEAMFVI